MTAIKEEALRIVQVLSVEKTSKNQYNSSPLKIVICHNDIMTSLQVIKWFYPCMIIIITITFIPLGLIYKQ